MLNWIQNNWEIIIAVGGILLGADGIAGILPDRWVGYIGVIRRLVPKIAAAVKSGGARSIIIGLVATLVASCAMQSTAMIDPARGPICAQDGFEKSRICLYLEMVGIPTAEDARDMILDANDISLIMEAYTIEQVALYLDKWDAIINSQFSTYEYFMSTLMQDTAKAARVAAILERRFGGLASYDVLIEDCDRQLLRLMSQRIRESCGLN